MITIYLFGAFLANICIAMEPDAIEMQVFKVHETKPLYYVHQNDQASTLPTVIIEESLSTSFFQKNRNFPEAVKDLYAMQQVNKHFYENSKKYTAKDIQLLAQQYNLHPFLVKTYLEKKSDQIATLAECINKLPRALKSLLAKQSARLAHVSPTFQAKILASYFNQHGHHLYSKGDLKEYYQGMSLTLQHSIFRSTFTLSLKQNCFQPWAAEKITGAPSLQTLYSKKKWFKTVHYELALEPLDLIIIPDKRVFILAEGWFRLDADYACSLSDSVCLVEFPSLDIIQSMQNSASHAAVILPRITFYPLIKQLNMPTKKVLSTYLDDDALYFRQMCHWSSLAYDYEKDSIVICNKRGDKKYFPLDSLHK